MNRREFTLATAAAMAAAQWPLNASAAGDFESEDDDSRQSGRRLGPDRARARRRDAVGEVGAVGAVRQQGRRGRHDRARAVRQRAKGDPNALLVGGMVMVGGIVLNKSPVDLTMVTPRRAADQRVPGGRGPGEFAVQDDGRPGQGVQGRSGQGVLERRLGRRHRSHSGWADRARSRRRPDQGQLHRVQRRRRPDREHRRRPRDGRQSPASASSPNTSRAAACAGWPCLGRPRSTAFRR